jgi:hypothetical protein
VNSEVEDSVVRPVGYVSVSKITAADGSVVPLEEAIRQGWVVPAAGEPPKEFEVAPSEAPAGPNLFLDTGRQLMAFAFGFRSPISNYVCQKFGVGTGLVSAKVTDVALGSPITLSNGATTKNIDSVDFLSAFIVRVAFTLALADANGYAISEMGLFSGNDTLIARNVRAVVINKTSDFAPTLTWRIRF